MLRISGLVTAVFVFLAVVTSPALGDDLVARGECGVSGGPGCEVTAESESVPSSPTGPTSEETAPEAGPNDGGTQTATAEPACEEEDSLTQRCTALAGGAGSGEEESAEEEVDHEAVAHAAYAEFSLSDPDISMSPSSQAPILVQVPVWLWLDSEAWSPESATASVPAGSVTVTATPSTVSWDMGDGTTHECDGPGTAYDPHTHDADAASPDCGHTFTSTGEHDVVAQISWEVEWTSTDEDGGTLPALSTESSTQVRVIESSGVVT